MLLVGLLSLVSEELIIESESSALSALNVEVLEVLLDVVETLASLVLRNRFVMLVLSSLEGNVSGVERLEHVSVVVDDGHLLDKNSSGIVDKSSNLSGGDSSSELISHDVFREVIEVEEELSLSFPIKVHFFVFLFLKECFCFFLFIIISRLSVPYNQR